MPLSTGQLLNNRYRIARLIGQGGFGAVYRAWDTTLNQPCAVKENLDTSAEAQRQFYREATLLAGLRHPNLPRVIDHFLVPGQGQYLVMDFVEGQSLADLASQRGRPLTEAEVLPWLNQVCDALAYLHSQNPPVIHRDIKPQNIIVTPAGQATLVDFGISKAYDPLLSTTSGARGVTSGFSPPEQYGSGGTNPRSDIYNLGATLYALFTGQTPPDAIDRLVRGARLPPLANLRPDLSPGMQRLVASALELSPAARPQSAVAVRQTLAGTSGSVTQLVSTKAKTARPPSQRSSLMVWAVATLVLGMVIAVGVWASGILRPRLTPPIVASVATSEPAPASTLTATPIPTEALPAASVATSEPAPAGTLTATPIPTEALPAATAAPAAATSKPKKIAFFVSDMTNLYHQGQAFEAQKYAREKYGAEVFIFDGRSDSAVMTANVDQILAQGMDAASLHIWNYETAKPAVQGALNRGIILTSFFSPLGDSGIPVARSDEKGMSFAMGAEMAKQWKEAHPDKPIVMVQLGWPNHTEVISGRTDPFVQGVLSVDPTAKNLGCQDASRGADAARQIIKDLVTQHPEVNLIYSEASNLTVGTMAGLVEAGRGKMKDGKPLTEIVASVDFDESEYRQVYDPNSSLKLSMGLPPLETGRGRIDLIMDVAAGKIPMTSQPANEQFYKAYDISYWTMPQAEAAKWLNTQFGTDITAPAAAAPAAPSAFKPATAKPRKIAFFVSDMTNLYHQGQAIEAQKYAKEKYGAEVFIFDGRSDSATMTANVDQILAQGMDAASLHIWNYETAKLAVQGALNRGIILTSFFSPLGDSGIPVARSDEAGVSFAMGAEMAKQWKEAHPDKPIVMVELGWPNHTEVISGRTDPFVQGVLSVDPTAKNLGCQDASRGADAARQIIKDLVTQHPEVNLIYSEASNLTVGTMAGLVEAGRGKMKDARPLTEIVASVDFDESEYRQVYDPNSSLKLSMGLPPLETGRGRIDLIMDVAAGKIPMTSQPADEQFYKAYDISGWSMPQAEAAKWLNTQFGTKSN